MGLHKVFCVVPSHTNLDNYPYLMELHKVFLWGSIFIF